jgi:endoglucanase
MNTCMPEFHAMSAPLQIRSLPACLYRAPVCQAATRPCSKRGLWLLNFSFVVLALYFGSSLTVAQPAFPLHTSGQSIVDSKGARVRLNAVNWYGAESTDFVVAGLQVASLQSIVQQIKSMGFNAVRLPWSNQLYESSPVVANYALLANPGMEGESALTILDQVIAALTDAGIMVILDNHNSDAEWCCSNTDGNTLWYNTGYPEPSWISDWEGIVLRYQANPWVIAADLRNEPRGDATWGGSPTTDWHAAAERGGNAVLSTNPSMLIMVGGVGGGQDLSGVSSLPVQLNIANHVVYSPHDYSFDYSGLTSFSDYLSLIGPRWGYLVTGSNPQPVWIGEFGTCNTSNACVSSNNSTDAGYWFGFFTTFVQQYTLDWSYWAINGTQSTGSSRTYGAPESYGILNPSWDGSALTALTSQLDAMITAAPQVALISGGNVVIAVPGESGSSTVAMMPQNGFTGAVNLSCTVSGGPVGAVDVPSCTVPASESIAGTSAVTAAVSVATAGPNTSSLPNPFFLSPAVSTTALVCVLLIGFPARRRKLLLPVLTVMAVALFSLSGCGNSSQSSTLPPATSAGLYTVTVTGIAAGLNPVAVQIPVTVQ